MHPPILPASSPAAPRRGLPQLVVPVMLSQRAYLLIALAISLVFGMIALPTGVQPRSYATPGEALLLCLNAVLVFEIQFWLHFLLRYRPSAVQRWFARQSLLVDRGLRAALTALLVTGYSLGRHYLDARLGIAFNQPSLPLLLTLAQIVSVVGLSCQLGIELVERSRYLAQEVETLKREQLQARYESLKQQLSPHFLFNSLSTLSGLIYDEPAAAERFVNEMAQVYRYLLRHGEQMAVPLHEELAFVRSYAYLLQMRFGEGLEVHVDLPPEVLGRPLPPLALQLLVENAVKHNTVSRRQPLAISISLASADQLRVCNPRYPRLSPEASSGTGLSNLTTRIRLLHQQRLLVEQTDHEFCVFLPLPASLS
ncbi:sensor histidine kinase [Hymenobacter sp. BT559]|uniref:sensor histidine kinase n=1 Tax=Hymenobacter sp. BT559 TaxID=2795729 RepID=UPI0018EAAE83|nr:histidine kinase [Hymenobacter sp. BT559]MBJ6145331.1 histidine kinase [Hymenobacter sp. BT559]